MNKNIAVFALIMLTLGTVATYSAPQVLADWLIDRSGTLIKLDPMVLGDDDVKVEDSHEISTETTTPASINLSTSTTTTIEPQKAMELQREQLKDQAELKRETVKTQQERVREVAKQQLERKIELNKKLNKNVKNEFALSAPGGELKVKQITKLSNGQERETELKLKENETLHVDQEDGESVDIKPIKPGELEIAKDKFKGHTRLPLSVNEDNELMVTRPDGSTKVVSVLPDEAVSKMIEKGILMTPPEGETPLTESVELTTNEMGDPVYLVKQEISKKFLGFIAMNFNRETTVSATDPNEVTTTSAETSPWRRFLERLAR